MKAAILAALFLCSACGPEPTEEELQAEKAERCPDIQKNAWEYPVVCKTTFDEGAGQ